MTSTSFSPGRERWLAGVGKTRDLVRQALVTRQLEAHLPPGSRVLDLGCGQGSQAIALARRGHTVTGVDLSSEMLAAASRAADDEPAEVRGRLRFEVGDALALGADGFDVVCCHGVAMYLPGLDELVAALVAAACPGGLISLLTRNRFGIAMRAGMTGDWAGALEGFDATHYTNRIGVTNARADEPAAVRATLSGAGAGTVAWYGVRLFTDTWDDRAPTRDFETVVAAEFEAGRRDPYRSVAALTHTIARRHG